MEENNFKKHETSTTYSFEDRTFEINKFDPMTGTYIMMQLFTTILPLGIGKLFTNQVKGSEKLVPSVGSDFKMMSKEEFIKLQIDILSTVNEKYSSGLKSPVVRENGSYGVNDVSMILIIKLLVASLTFNFTDFFGESQSTDGFGEILDLFQQNS